MSNYGASILAWLFLLGCSQQYRGTVAQPSRIPRSDNAIVTCWFVVSDGSGHSGYSGLDATDSSSTFKTCPLFKTISEFRAAIHAGGFTNIHVANLNGFTQEGWTIRNLTPNELKAVQ
jgi:hypothetical protein